MKLGILALTALCASTFVVSAVAMVDRPNIVLIYADDLGWGDLRSFNPESKINTLVVFTSDNGPDHTPKFKELGDDGIMAYERIERFKHASMGPWRATKHTAWEGGHRVPFIARWPGRIPAGTSTDRLICQTDLFASFATFARASFPEKGAEDSLDVSSLLLGGEQPVREGGIFASGLERVRSTRLGSWVLIEDSTPDKLAPYWAAREPRAFRSERGIAAAFEPVMLYDLVADPGQTKNLAKSEPARVEELRAYRAKLVRDGHRTGAALGTP